MPGDGVIDDDATLTKVKRVSRHKEEEEKERERQDGDRLQINL